MSVYIIGIGGTGARCIEAIIHAAATGLLEDRTINLLFVDADETNGNLDRAQRTLDLYQRCQALNLADEKIPWMKVKFENFGLWSPFSAYSTNKNLGSFFEYNNLQAQDSALGGLFDVLYTGEERNATLDVGFRGRPAIGAAVMSQVNLDALNAQPWGNLIGQLGNESGGGSSETKIFLCGSIFGGTGASGLPTIGRLLHNKLEQLEIREKVELGCLYVLPYFGFNAQPGEEEKKVYARSEQFLLNTEAALRYYGNQAGETFNATYLLGNQNLSPVDFSIGKNTQRNAPHFLELYAALALRDFVSQSKNQAGKVVLISRKQQQKITWNDLPDHDEVKAKLVNATRFAYAWLGNIAPELADAKEMGVKEFRKYASWFVKFFPARGGFLGKSREQNINFNDAQQQDAIELVSEWCQDYLCWLASVHDCQPEKIALFQSNYFDNLESQLNIEHLSDLVLDDSRDRTKKTKDTIQRLKERLNPEALTPPNQGTVGLAKALYLVTRL